MLAGTFAGCAEAPPKPPSAVIRATPDALCEGDDFTTPIVLQGRESMPSLSLVPLPPPADAVPLVFRWTLSGAQVRWVEGDLSSVEVTVTSAGDRPLHAALAVTNGEGATTVGHHTVAVVLAGTDGCP